MGHQSVTAQVVEAGCVTLQTLAKISTCDAPHGCRVWVHRNGAPSGALAYLAGRPERFRGMCNSHCRQLQKPAPHQEEPERVEHARKPHQNRAGSGYKTAAQQMKQVESVHDESYPCRAFAE